MAKTPLNGSINFDQTSIIIFDHDLSSPFKQDFGENGPKK